jgi:uncharacterized membrane protein YfcA
VQVITIKVIELLWFLFGLAYQMICTQCVTHQPAPPARSPAAQHPAATDSCFVHFLVPHQRLTVVLQSPNSGSVCFSHCAHHGTRHCYMHVHSTVVLLLHRRQMRIHWPKVWRMMLTTGCGCA